jgi:hypothetical protein
MSNQTAKAFETFSGTVEERGHTLAKLEKDRVTSLEKANTKDTVFNGLAYQLGKLIHELTLESDSGRITSDRLQATSMNKVASQRRSEALQLYRNFDAIQEWLKGRVVKKRKQKIAFTSLTAMLKAFKFETQPRRQMINHLIHHQLRLMRSPTLGLLINQRLNQLRLRSLKQLLKCREHLKMLLS